MANAKDYKLLMPLLKRMDGGIEMKLKHHIPTSLEHLKPIIVRVACYIGIAIALMASFTVPTNALKQPHEYGFNQCELIAKDYIQVYGGNYVFIQPLKPNDAFDFGEYSGHFVNRAYSKSRGVYFLDYKTKTYFNNTDEIKQWYYNRTKHNSIVYDFMIERPGFGIKWHY